MNLLNGLLQTNNEMNARYQAFDTAEHLARSADASWEAVKDRGNAALKEGDHLGAARLYRGAAQLALGPLENGTIHAFIEALETWPEASAHRRLAETSDVLWDNLLVTLPTPPLARKMQLSNDEEQSADHPNKGASIAWANQAQAFLAAGKPKKALMSARRATAANPAYVKAHHREMKALEVLGQREEAAKVRKGIENFGKLKAMKMQEALALVAVGWIDWNRAKMIYLPTRFRVAADELSERMSDGEKRIEVRASIVPFQGGQGLILSVLQGDTDEKIDCLDFYMLDGENGEMADRLPNGCASETALKYAPHVIGKCIEELEEWGLKTVSVMCGQGLTQHVTLLEKQLKQGSKGTFSEKDGVRPIDGLVVYRANSTAASEDSGVVPPEIDFSPGAMAAKAARLGVL